MALRQQNPRVAGSTCKIRLNYCHGWLTNRRLDSDVIFSPAGRRTQQETLLQVLQEP